MIINVYNIRLYVFNVFAEFERKRNNMRAVEM